MNNKNKSLADKIPKRVWLLISFAVAMLFWYILSIIPSTSRAFQNVVVVCQSIKTMIDRGVLGTDILSSLISVVAGYVLGFVIALPVAILRHGINRFVILLNHGSSSSVTSHHLLMYHLL